MARATTSTVVLPLERTQPFRDHDGVLSWAKHEDDDLQLTLDFTNWLASGETVSSVTYDSSGVTISGSSVSSPNITFTVLGVGSSDASVETSARTKVVPLRFYDIQGAKALDYQI